MDNDGEKKFSSEESPVDWYIGSYLLRFVEIDASRNEDPDASFLTWENTVIVRAGGFEEAFRKVESVGRQQTGPYRGGADGVQVQSLFEGVTQLLPVYEPLEDGAEIMWKEHVSVALGQIRSRSASLEQLRERFRDDDAKRALSP